VIHGGTFSHPNQVIREAIESLGAFKRINTVTDEVNEMVRGLHVWQAPPPGYYKANWDAAVDIKRGRRGFGAIIRDSGGHEVVARSTTQNSIVDPIVVEAWAGMVAANLCKDVGVFLILFSNQIPSKL
jgi:hypothetical protein